MPSEENKFETLNLRFRAVDSDASGSLPGGWLPWSVGGLLAGVVFSTVSFWFVRKELTVALGADDPTRAILAIESLSQLESNYARSVIEGIKNPNYEIASASMKAVQNLLYRQTEQGSDAEVLETLQLLTNMPADIPADSQSLIREALVDFRQTYTAEQQGLEQAIAMVTDYLATNPELSVSADSILAAAPEEPEIRIDEPTARISESSSVPPPLAETTEPPAKLPNSGSYALRDPANLALEKNHALGSTPDPQAMNIGSQPFPQDGTYQHFADNPANSSIPQGMQTLQPPQTIETSSRQPNGYPAYSQSGSLGMAEPLGAPAQVARSVGEGSRMALSDERVVSGLEQRNGRQLVKLLASGNGNWRKAAVLELRSRGWTDTEIQLASELATGSEIRRRELVEQISRSMDMDPKFWLLWMAEAGEPSVRKLSVSLLSSMVDTDVERALRIIAMRETDASVRETISRTLLAAANRNSPR